MAEVMYNPSDVGKEVTNIRGNKSIIRKYHMTDGEKLSAKANWDKEIEHVDSALKLKAGALFFNPYRKGIYYYQLYALFMLGCNEWHIVNDVITKVEDLMSQKFVIKDGKTITVWDKFKGKSSKADAVKSKDFVGRIQENMVFFQRLNKLHPTGYKVRQVCSSVDIKRENKAGLPNGLYLYRLSTYSSEELALPTRDFSNFDFSKSKSNYVNYKFIGTTITDHELISNGVVLGSHAKGSIR
jgi:hypothetical protein